MSDLLVVGALVPFGWTDRVRALFHGLLDDQPDRHVVPARVVRVERSSCIVVGADGTESLAQAPVLPAVGDWVAVRDGVVQDVLPRWSAVTRRDPSGTGVQVLAANADLVLITTPADRFSAARVERELALAWDSGAQPVVVVTKADLAPHESIAALDARLVGVDLLVTSVTTGLGIDELRAALQPCRTAVFLGPSGSGKSTLTNALVGAETQATGAVREGDHRGRHTTTSRQLLAVPGGGVLIDTPGLRSLSLAGDGEGLERVFADIEELAAGCRFADCQHEVEPGCAVNDAISSGTLDPARLASYRKLEREMAADARKSDPLLRQAAARVWKSRTKAVRAHDKRKRG